MFVKDVEMFFSGTRCGCMAECSETSWYCSLNMRPSAAHAWIKDGFQRIDCMQSLPLTVQSVCSQWSVVDVSADSSLCGDSTDGLPIYASYVSPTHPDSFVHDDPTPSVVGVQMTVVGKIKSWFDVNHGLGHIAIRWKPQKIRFDRLCDWRFDSICGQYAINFTEL